MLGVGFCVAIGLIRVPYIQETPCLQVTTGMIFSESIPTSSKRKKNPGAPGPKPKNLGFRANAKLPEDCGNRCDHQGVEQRRQRLLAHGSPPMPQLNPKP